ncbi:MAG: response regulator transcription factor [Ignavibacteria bacterium]|nr:response regulator transcription factor [Ignavibacteria bacterium]
MTNILLADDHLMFREGLKQILGRCADLRIAAEAGDGQEALELVQAGGIDAVVLDISMPGRSGFDVLVELKREYPDLPVLVLSMHPENQYAIRVLKAGASGYLTKESAADELIAAIRKVAAGGRYVSASLAEKLADALVAPSVADPHQELSNREFQVLLMLAQGRTLREMADALLISEKTVTTYRARILEKLGLRNNAELTRYAIDRHLLP